MTLYTENSNFQCHETDLFAWGWREGRDDYKST